MVMVARGSRWIFCGLKHGKTGIISFARELSMQKACGVVQ